MAKDITQFDNVYYDLSEASGRLRLAASGLGWKQRESEGPPVTFAGSDIRSAAWSRTGRGFELRLGLRNGNAVVFDGFEGEDHKAMEEAIRRNLDIPLETVEHSLRGWNWGKTAFRGREFVFSVAGRPAFEIPVGRVSNSNLTGRNEVSLEFQLGRDDPQSGKSAQVDELAEMRIYVPGTVDDEGPGSDAGEGEEGETLAAQQLYDTIREKADIGEVAGDSIVAFVDTFFTTPRGRYDIEMFPTFLRLRGKTYDYKVQYSSIVRLFLLPKSDDVHVNFVIGLDPPLRQGQTRYSFLVAQFPREEEMEVELNLTDEEYEEKYKGKLEREYDAAAYKVVSQVFKGLADCKITTPGTFSSHYNQPSVKCSYKANEGQLYMLERSILFIPKPPIFMSLADVLSVTLSRVGASVTASRTFDILFQLKGGIEQQFSNVNREEQPPLEAFLKSKGIKVRDETNDTASAAMIKAALDDDELDDDEDDEDGDADRGSAADDSESPDEDFSGGSDSEVAEEYDENAEDSGSASEAEDDDEEEEEDDDEDFDDDEEEEERPAKKRK